MKKTIIKNAIVVNEGEIGNFDILINGNIIEKIEPQIDSEGATEINAEGLHLFPGVIDDQVHFREPGLTHKGEIYTESRAAVAGGVTSFMDQPNTVPQATSVEELEKKYTRASQCSLANYSFFMGGTNKNIEEVLKVDFTKVGALKLFLGSSTGDMLVDSEKAREDFFSQVNSIICVHSEDDVLIKETQKRIIEEYGEDIPAYFHPIIRSEEACYNSTKKAVELAKKHNTRLHVFHISTAKELSLFSNKIPLKDKLITAEACIHHLWFCDEDYSTKGNFIKWNPAVKTAYDRDKIFEAVLNDTIDVVATDHAPHTIEEKNQSYLKAPSGGPLIQHSLQAMLQFYKQGKISLTHIAKKMAHDPATLFNIEKRGFIREGYFADLALVNLKKPQVVTKESLLYKCGWSPFENYTFDSTIEKTFVNGHLAYDASTSLSTGFGKFDESQFGDRLIFGKR